MKETGFYSQREYEMSCYVYRMTLTASSMLYEEEPDVKVI
jgi:hypothetical protein